jgi:hypothetical protein
MDAELLELMPDTVVLEPYLSQDSYGQATYGAASTYQAHIGGGGTRLGRNADGSEIVSNADIHLASVVGVTVQDRITLPARWSPRQPRILKVDLLSDENGAYSDVVYT